MKRVPPVTIKRKRESDMGNKTGINYLDSTWSPITGCSGKGCKVKDQCWARAMAKRFPQIHIPKFIRETYKDDDLIPFSKVQFHENRLDKPLHWRKPRRIGVCFTGDMFDWQVKHERIDEIVHIMQDTKHLYFVLTKQPENLVKWYMRTNVIGGGDWTHNIYWGVSCCDQDDADRMIPELLKIPGKHWVSIEPMLGSIELVSWYWRCNIDWVVIGCESGPKRRPMPLEWTYDVVNRCQDAEIPIFVKQLNIGAKVVHDINEFPSDLQIREWPEE